MPLKTILQLQVSTEVRTTKGWVKLLSRVSTEPLGGGINHKKISTTGLNQYNTRRLKHIKPNKKTKIIIKKIKEKQQNCLKTTTSTKMKAAAQLKLYTDRHVRCTHKRVRTTRNHVEVTMRRG